MLFVLLPPGEPVGQAIGLRQVDEAGRNLLRGRVADRGAAADRVADEHDRPGVDGREEAGEELGVAARRRRLAVGIGPTGSPLAQVRTGPAASCDRPLLSPASVGFLP